MQLDRFAVIGHPIGHTMSPFIHTRLFSLSGLSPAYSVLDVPVLADAVTALRQLNGFNITIPHKTAILPFLDEVSEKALCFGSVNTVKNENGRLCGYTTDGIGCLKALGRAGLDFSGRVLLLGNGGAARAIAFEAVLTASTPILDLAVRPASLEKAEALKGELLALCNKLLKPAQIRVLSYDALEKEEYFYDLLLNTTSVGMYPNANAAPVGESVLSRCSAVFDAVYNPGETALLRLAKSLGTHTIGGMGMLVCQAAAAHEIWYGAKFDDSAIEQLILDAQRETTRLFCS